MLYLSGMRFRYHWSLRAARAIVFGLFIPLYINAGPLEDGHAAFDAQRYDAAFKAWSPLAEQDNAEAQYNLALLYMKGLGVKQDDRKALEWLHKAARQGMLDAQYNLGVMYHEGKGAYRSEKSAVEWWQLAAEQGHANAQYNLGVMYAMASGVKQDANKALQLWQDAARQGHTDAIDMLVRAYSGEFAGFKADPAQAKHWQTIKQTSR